METNKDEIVKALKTLLKGTYFTKFTYGITYFELELINEPLSISADFSVSDFELEDRKEWEKWVRSYPFNIDNFNGPEEPTKVFLMGLLTQAGIEEVEEEDNGTLIFQFQNNLRVRIKGEDETADNSWNLKFRDAYNEEIGNCNCSFNEMFLVKSEVLSNKINSIER